MKTEYVKINLSDLVEKYGESRVKAILADFSCPLYRVRDLIQWICYPAK